MPDPTLQRRTQLLGDIETARGARVISLVLGDRAGVETKIAGDLLPFVYDRLRAIGEVEEIDLFLYTIGGDSLAGWGLVNLIREHCHRLVVLAPFRCMSCGTLMALGADEIILTAGSELSPIDPSVSSLYNPQVPGGEDAQTIGILPVSVEDLMGFLRLVKNEVGLKEDEALGRVVEQLSQKVHPLALGAVYRAREQVAFLARKLLGFHIGDPTRIDMIVDYLTRSMDHQYIISRNEARQVLGLDMVPEPDDSLQEMILSLYDAYREFLQLDSPFSPEAELGDEEHAIKTYPRAALEVLQDGTLASRVFRSVRDLQAVEMAQPNVNIPVIGVQIRTLAEGWAVWPDGGNND